METTALTHVAMAVAPGTLTPAYCDAVREFYGDVFGWRELEELRRPDRLTIAIANRSYVNLREHESASTLTYEHFGVLVRSAEAVVAIRDRILAKGVGAGAV